MFEEHINEEKDIVKEFILSYQIPMSTLATNNGYKSVSGYKKAIKKARVWYPSDTEVVAHFNEYHNLEFTRRIYGKNKNKTIHLIIGLTLTEKEAYKLYSEQGKTFDYISNHVFNGFVSSSSIKDFVRRNYPRVRRTDNEVSNSLRATTNKERYGDSEFFKTKAFSIKSKKTVNARYGTDYYTASKDFKYKADKTNINRYGTKNPGSLPEFKSKANSTIMEKYGVTSSLILPKTRKALINHNMSVYGHPYPLENKSVQFKAYTTRESNKSLNMYWNKSTSVFSTFDEAYETMKDSKKLDEFIKGYLDKVGKSTITLHDLSKISGFSYGTLISGTSNISIKVSDYPWVEVDRNFGNEQKEIGDYLNILKVNFLSDYRPDFMKNPDTGVNLELDFYIPEYKVAIEYNGSLWHSEKYDRDKKYHQLKKELCRNAGVNLIHIWDYDWHDNDKKDIIKSQIAYQLHSDKIIKYNARQLNIKKVSKKDADLFMLKNHIQGFGANGFYRIGLYQGDLLVSLMIIGKKRFNTSDIDWELQRFCSKKYTSIRGGATRLFKHFLNNYPEINKVVSFANDDFAYSPEKSVYPILGFKYTETYVSRYKWVKYEGGVIRTLSRHKTQIKNIRKWAHSDTLKTPFNGASKDVLETDTENSYMERQGYVKAWNAGNDKYVYTRKG